MTDLPEMIKKTVEAYDSEIKELENKTVLQKEVIDKLMDHAKEMKIKLEYLEELVGVKIKLRFTDYPETEATRVV